MQSGCRLVWLIDLLNDKIFRILAKNNATPLENNVDVSIQFHWHRYTKKHIAANEAECTQSILTSQRPIRCVHFEFSQGLLHEVSWKNILRPCVFTRLQLKAQYFLGLMSDATKTACPSHERLWRAVRLVRFVPARGAYITKIFSKMCRMLLFSYAV